MRGIGEWGGELDVGAEGLPRQCLTPPSGAGGVSDVHEADPDPQKS